MKTKLFQLLILFLLLFYGCKPEDKEPPCTDTKTLEFMLSEEAKSKVPYLKPDFDTLSFASDKGDTLVFVRQPVTYGWYCNYPYSTVYCPGDKHCYENYGAKYTCIKGSGSFEFRHWLKATDSYLSLPTTVGDAWSNAIQVKLNQFNFITYDYWVGRTQHPKYMDSLVSNGRTFTKLIYDFHNSTDSLSGTGYYNEGFGLFRVQDVTNSNYWTIIKP